jgi:hypothetical protein
MMPVKVIVREYIEQLREAEDKKPVGHRREIPTVTDFANAAGVSNQAYIDFSKDRTQTRLNRPCLSATIKLLRNCGFDTDVSDLLIYIE